jgi:RNA polymerase sigma-70 factor (sigma-E family)
VKRKEQHEAEFLSFATAHRTAMRRQAFLLCGDWFEADDIVQKALTKLFAAWKRVEPGGAPAYTRRIVLNVYLSHRRLAWVRRERATGETPDLPYREPQDDVDIDLRRAVGAALDRLPIRQRTTLVLRFWQDLSVDDTAAAMGCSPGTVKSHTARGLKSMRAHLDESAFALMEKEITS